MRPDPSHLNDPDLTAEYDLRRALTEGGDRRRARLASGMSRVVDTFLHVRAAANAALPQIGRGLRDTFIILAALSQFIAIVVPAAVSFAVTILPLLIVIFLFLG